MTCLWPPVQAAEFYKTWDRYGSLSNFSPHPIWMPGEAVSELNSQLLIAQAAHHLSSGAPAPAGAPPPRPAQQNGVPRAGPAAAQLQQQPGAAGLPQAAVAPAAGGVPQQEPANALSEAEGLQLGLHGQGKWWPTLEHYYQAQKFNWDCRRGLQGDHRAACSEAVACTAQLMTPALWVSALQYQLPVPVLWSCLAQFCVTNGAAG